MKNPSRSLFFAVVASSMLLPVFATLRQPIGEREAIQMRALLDTSAPVNTNTKAASSTSAQTATSNAPTTSATTAAAATTTAAASSVTPTSAAVTPTHATSSPASSASQSQETTLVATTTDSSGQLVTSVIVETPSMSSPTPSHTSSSNNDSGSGGGLGTGSIVGLSVAGGIAAIGIILFFVWKFTRKRFADFDDNEAIKWPELNSHNSDVHALPTKATGRAGFGPENDSDFNLTRAASPGGAYAHSITASVPDMHGTSDPYAVPPLPHLNPNQPYRDEPGAYGQPGYYDPYRGPVPNTFADTVSDAHGTEAIPMTRMRSPGPQVAYDMQGRSSPAPQAAMGYPGMDERSRTPVPGVLATGRASPSPYGYGQH